MEMEESGTAKVEAPVVMNIVFCIHVFVFECVAYSVTAHFPITDVQF